MSEILQIYHHSPSSQDVQPACLVDVESQFKWSFESEFPPLDVTDNFLMCSELAGSPFTEFSSSSVDELSKVTAMVKQNHCFKKRKLECNVVEADQSVECDSGLVELPKAKRKTRNGSSDDYIHVRARRGQATDSHSLAERVRREKIKKKMQVLQDLVPGCNKLSNKAAILDEIINYVHCLQMEVETLKRDKSLPKEIPACMVVFQQQSVHHPQYWQ